MSGELNVGFKRRGDVGWSKGDGMRWDGALGGMVQ